MSLQLLMPPPRAALSPVASMQDNTPPVGRPACRLTPSRRVDALWRSFCGAGQVDGDAVRAVMQSVRGRDRRAEALCHLMLGAVHRPQPRPWASIEHLAAALRLLPDGSAERELAVLEQAVQWRLHGAGARAVATLDGLTQAGAVAHGAAQALRALALLDGGQVEAARCALHGAAQAFLARRGAPATRLRRHAALLLAEAQLAFALADAGLDAALAEAVMAHAAPPGPHAPAAPGTADLPVSVVALATTLDEITALALADPAVQALLALGRAVVAAAVPGSAGAARTRPVLPWALSDAGEGAQALLWHGEALRVAGDPCGAVRALDAAVQRASAQGLWCVARQAWYGLALAYAAAERPHAAWQALRQLRVLEWRSRPDREAGTPAGGSADCGTPPLAPPASAPAVRVRRAQRFIDEHLHQPLDVERIATACGVSRRTLELAFRRELGCGVGAHVRERRLARVRQRLRDSDAPLKCIASDTGFTSPSALCREFKRAMGLSPTAWRHLAAD